MPCDYKKYHPDWHTKIRPAVLERANNCCEECRVKNKTYVFRGIWEGQKVFQTNNGDLFKESGELIMHNSEYEEIQGKTPNSQAIKIILTIAHLNHDITDNRLENLKALCQLHHLLLDKEHHMKNSRTTRDNKKKLQSLF